MTWTLIESATEHDAVLELYGKDGKFMIRANGLELMNGFSHESETALGAFAAGLAPSDGARFLVGGLGLGYTVAALVAALEDRGTVTVAELSSAVIAWFERHVKASVLPHDPANLTIVTRRRRRAPGRAWPLRCRSSWMSTTGQNLLLLRQMLASIGPTACGRCIGSLSERGVALLWSGFESADFAARAQGGRLCGDVRTVPA